MGTSNSMALNLKKWRDVMEAYLDEAGAGPGFAYYTTMPTDALQLFRDAAFETQKIGWKKVEKMFEDQGKKVYDLLEKKFGLKILAAEGVRAPGVVVAYAPEGTNMVGEFK